jgi:hypothetical protein
LGGVNGFVYPTNPVQRVNPLGLLDGTDVLEASKNVSSTILPLSAGAIEAAGNDALVGGVAAYKAMEIRARTDYNWYKRMYLSPGVEEHYAFQPSAFEDACIFQKVSQNKWEVLDELNEDGSIKKKAKSFEEQFAALAIECMKK